MSEIKWLLVKNKDLDEFRDSFNLTEDPDNVQLMVLRADDLIEAVRGQLKYVHDKYPGEPLICPHMQKMEKELKEIDEWKS